MIAASVGILVHYLAEHPHLQQRLREDLSRLPAAIDEILRILAPLIANRRITARPVEIGGRRLEAGENKMGLRLFVRKTAGLAELPAASVIQGGVLDTTRAQCTVKRLDIVYANLTGTDLDAHAKSVIAAMDAESVKQLIFVRWESTRKFPAGLANGTTRSSART